MVEEKELSKDLGDLGGVYGVKPYPHTGGCPGRVILSESPTKMPRCAFTLEKLYCIAILNKVHNRPACWILVETQPAIPNHG